MQEPHPASSRLTEVEIASAVSRRCREGDLTTEQRDAILGVLRRHFSSLFVVELSAAVARTSQELSTRHALRAGDAIHLASSLHLQDESGESVEFITYDKRLEAAARSERLQVL